MLGGREDFSIFVLIIVVWERVSKNVLRPTRKIQIDQSIACSGMLLTKSEVIYKTNVISRKS